MANSPVGSLMRCLRTAALRADEGPSDGLLLERFINGREEAAFEALVRRHAPLVFGVCRRVLGNIHDAEDAFQATFLVLLRKASSLRRGGTLGNWLYGVAYRTALEARAAAARRRRKEASVGPSAAGTPDEVTRELLPFLDEELTRLPDKYRAPLVLCELEGKTRKEASRLLGWPEGTVAGRLARARSMLARRLARHGVALAGGPLVLALGETTAWAAVPASLVNSTVRVVSYPPASVAGLVEGVLKTMLLHKLRIGLWVVLAVGLLGSSAGLLAWRACAGALSDEARPPRATAQPAALPAEKADAPAAGYRWVADPRNGRGSPWAIGRQVGKGVVAIEETDKDGGLVFTLAHPPTINQARLPEYRPVAFDGQGKRHVLERLCGAETGQVAMYRFRLDPKKLAAEKVDRLGVEMLTPEGVQLLIREAVARAKKQGVEVLPPAQVGEKYEFTLTTLDGRKVRSQDLRGKVVLIDCWATWCSPCMALLPEIKALHEKWHAMGLEVVGVSLDQDAAKVGKAVERLKLNWPQVLVPADEDARLLWQEASGIGTLPRVLLIDREGVLRADGVTDIEKKAEELLNTGDSSRGKGKP